MPTQTIHLSDERRIDIIAYLVRQAPDKHADLEYWQDADGDELLDAYNYSRMHNGLPAIIAATPQSGRREA